MNCFHEECIFVYMTLLLFLNCLQAFLSVHCNHVNALTLFSQSDFFLDCYGYADWLLKDYHSAVSFT